MPFDSACGLAQGILPGWPAMSEPGGSPETKRQVSRMEAAGVELDGRSRTGLFCVFPWGNTDLKTPDSPKCMGSGTKQVHGVFDARPAGKAISYHLVI